MHSAISLPTIEGIWALFLDVDGTLVPIAPAPDAVVVDGRVIALLDRLDTALDGAVALISGRTIAKLDELFAPLRLAGAGNHGLERRNAAGTVTGPDPDMDPAALDPVRAAFADFAAATDGVLVEDKIASVALHYRRAPGAEPDARRLARRLAAALGPAFHVQHGKMLAEVRPAGTDKGRMVDAFMAEPPFAGRVPVFIGDDITDEDGFEAVNRLGGHSIRIGGAENSAARWCCPDVAALLDWLDGVAALPTEAG